MRLTAEEARKMTRNKHYDLDDVYSEIVKCAAHGRSNCSTVRPLSQMEVEILEKDGFTVYSLGSMAIQKDGLYNSVSWKKGGGS